jgi:hypothetical protein
MAPAYEEVSGIFKPSDPVVVAEVNCDEHKDLCSRFGVRGYPTLKWFDAGSSDPTDYAGGRSVEDFVAAINEKVGTSRRVAKAPSSVVELTASNFDAIILGTDLNKWRLVEYYASWCEWAGYSGRADGQAGGAALGKWYCKGWGSGTASAGGVRCGIASGVGMGTPKAGAPALCCPRARTAHGSWLQRVEHLALSSWLYGLSFLSVLPTLQAATARPSPPCTRRWPLRSRGSPP